MMNYDNIYGFVIDTNAYAGNFEREMCAFITGQIGDCEVGIKDGTEFYQYVENDAELFHLHEEILESIKQVPDKHGYHRPVSIFQNANGQYNSVVVYFSNLPSHKLIQFMIKRSKKYANRKQLNIFGFRIIFYPAKKCLEMFRYDVDGKQTS